jgi:glycosidase
LLATYLIQNSIWWVEYAHLAGIRMDTYSYPDMQFMAEWTRRMMEEYPNFSIVGEEWSDNPAIVSYWQRGKKNANGYVSDLTSVMDFPMQDALSRAMREEESPYMSGLIRLYRMLANDFLYPAPNELVVFLDNHDMSRYYTQMDEDPALLRLGLAVLLTTRGVPQIYYGTEVLLSNKGTDDHGVIRADFPGGWKGDKVNGFTGEGLSKEAAATRKFVQTLLQWRKNATAVHTGELRHYAPENGIYVFFRYDAQQRVMVVVNKNNQPTSLSLGRFREQLGTAAKGVNVIDGQAFDLSGETIQLPAKAPLVLELE